MTPLRQRMIDAMVQRGFAARTQESYVDAIARMSRYYGRDPSTYAAADVETYLLHMIKEKKLSYSTVNQAVCASRFLFETVLGFARAEFLIPMARAPQTQPHLLARAEIVALFDACAQPTHRTLLQTVYATGLRVSEACALRLTDVDSQPDRMSIRVEQGKGAKDRYTLLAPTLLGPVGAKLQFDDIWESVTETCRPDHSGTLMSPDWIPAATSSSSFARRYSPG